MSIKSTKECLVLTTKKGLAFYLRRRCRNNNWKFGQILPSHARIIIVVLTKSKKDKSNKRDGERERFFVSPGPPQINFTPSRRLGYGNFLLLSLLMLYSIRWLRKTERNKYPTTEQGCLLGMYAGLERVFYTF